MKQTTLGHPDIVNIIQVYNVFYCYCIHWMDFNVKKGIFQSEEHNNYYYHGIVYDK